MMESETPGSRRKRKEEAKQLKRQRIEQSDGVRPRKPEASPKNSQLDAPATPSLPSNRPSVKRSDSRNVFSGVSSSASSGHRFGRVMDTVPCRNQPRVATVSIAIPGSVVANCQTRELKTQISGQIARAATIYHVDEIIVFDDKLSKGDSASRRPFVRHDNKGESQRSKVDHSTDSSAPKSPDDTEMRSRPSDPHAFLARILQYCECPQYLRRHFFPMHTDLQFAGLLAPVDAPHHVRADDRCPFREGVVLDKTHKKGSLVNCGIFKRPVHIDQRLQPGIRCTVQLDPSSYGRPGQMHGTVVSPSSVTERDGTYWGYTVRIASSIKAVFDECPYEGDTYDLTIGTSERGHESVDDSHFSLRKQRSSPNATSTYRHALVVFGGVAGIEECVDADESLKLAGSASSTMFDKWVNICSFQGSRTIRSEEAVLIALAKLSPFLAEAACTTAAATKESTATKVISADVTLNDDVSDESSVDDHGDDQD